MRVHIKIQSQGKGKYSVVAIDESEDVFFPLDKVFVGNHRQVLIEKEKRFNFWCDQADTVQCDAMPIEVF